MSDSTTSFATSADRDLIQRVVEGDEGAIGVLYDRFGPMMYAVAYRIVGQRADAEEAVMEAFAQVWREAPRFEAGRGSAAAWLTMIARSRALDLVRARDRRERITASAAREKPEAAPAMGAWRSDPSEAVEQSERRHRVEEALRNLNPAQRVAIELAYYEGLSQSEIAERLNEPLGTVKTRVRLGMQKLRDALSSYCYERGGGT